MLLIEIYRLMSRKNIYADGQPAAAIPTGQTVAVTAANSEKPKNGKAAGGGGGCCK